MDLDDDARVLLGTGPDAGADELRRAYLRACKRHPPETDPEGFARVRAAYERLRDGAAPPPDTDPNEPRELAGWSAWLGTLGGPIGLLEQAPDARLDACAEAVTRALAASGGELSPDDVAPLVMVPLVLWARGREAHAHPLVEALRRVPTSGPGGAPADPGDGRALWALVRELDVLETVSVGLTGALAEAILRDDDGPLVRWLNDETPASRTHDREAVAAYAPSLAVRFQRVFAEHAPYGDHSMGGAVPLIGIPLVIVIIFGLIALVTGDIECGS